MYGLAGTPIYDFFHIIVYLTCTAIGRRMISFVEHLITNNNLIFNGLQLRIDDAGRGKYTDRKIVIT